MMDKCENCLRFGHESCRHEAYDKCNYYPKPLSCGMVLEGDDAERFVDEMLNLKPLTEKEKEINQRVVKELERMEHEEFIKMIEKCNCSNCGWGCNLPCKQNEHVCKDWEKR